MSLISTILAYCFVLDYLIYIRIVGSFFVCRCLIFKVRSAHPRGWTAYLVYHKRFRLSSTFFSFFKTFFLWFCLSVSLKTALLLYYIFPPLSTLFLGFFKNFSSPSSKRLNADKIRFSARETCTCDIFIIVAVSL